MFIDLLQRLCDEKGIAMSALLDQVGMSRGNIARWKIGLTPKPSSRRRLAEALGISWERLEAELDLDEMERAETLTDEKIKRALFGDLPASDALYQEVKRYARYLALEAQRKAKEGQESADTPAKPE